MNFSIDVEYSVAAYFIIGYFYHTGLYVQQDIKKAIKSYKEASSFNSTIAKNNLGIIYKNGIENEIKKELGWAIEYFKEAIKLSNHPIPLYNLAHLYFYEKPIENSNLESIKLLMTSSKFYHYPSMFLLCIISIYEFGNDITDIIKELNKIEPISYQLINSIINIFYSNRLDQESILKEKYEQYRNIDYIFDYDFYYSDLSKRYDFLENGIVIKEEEEIAENINSEFYEGFRI